jgi:hypothetical protein
MLLQVVEKLEVTSTATSGHSFKSSRLARKCRQRLIANLAVILPHVLTAAVTVSPLMANLETDRRALRR